VNPILKKAWQRLLLVCCMLFAAMTQAHSDELVILTTFSSEPMSELVSEFNQRYPNVNVRLVHRRTQSIIQLLNKRYIHDIDVVLSSSPVLMQHLSDVNRLSTNPVVYTLPKALQGFVLPPADQVVTVGYSGAGIIWNRDYLHAHNLPLPTSFSSLTDSRYSGHLTMSTPSRSGTTRLMLESILARYGWEDGWRIILNVGANLATVSSRSFGVSDYVAKGQLGIGPTIDSYAFLLQRKMGHIKFRYDNDFTAMPTYVAQLSDGHTPYAQAFIHLLLSPSVQNKMDTISFAKMALDDDLLLSKGLPKLSLATVLQREKLVDHIFDTAITRRLPELQDSWQSLINRRVSARGDVDTLRKLDKLKQQMFSLPVTEAQITELGNKLNHLDNSSDVDQAMIRLMLTEFDHELNRKLTEQGARVAAELRAIRQAGQR
jgi:phosphoglycerate transport regulatory protein PgtC